MTQNAAPPSNDIVSFMHHLADISAEIIAPHFRAITHVENKLGLSGYDPVTKADREAETVIRDALRERFPDHGIIGEEFGTHGEDADCQWIIDPIDGTRAFIMGLPVWGTLIGFSHCGIPIIGLMNQPFTGERYWNDDRAAHYRGPNGTGEITTRGCNSIGEAVLSTTTPDMFEPGEEAGKFERVRDLARMTRYGGDCYAYCLLASGLIDVIIESSLKTYDIAALIPIVERAGGRVTDWHGGSAAGGGQVVASGDPHLHDEVLKLLQQSS